MDTLLEQVDLEVSWGNRKLESRLEGIQKSRLLLYRLDMLTLVEGMGEEIIRKSSMTFSTASLQGLAERGADDGFQWEADGASDLCQMPLAAVSVHGNRVLLRTEICE